MDHRERDRGREAERPGEIPARGWRDIALRVKQEVKQDNLSIVAAGVAFYSFLAMFPALASLISIYGLVADPADVQRQVAGLAGILPEGARGLLQDQLGSIARASEGALGFGAMVGIFLTLWSANKGVTALIQGLNIAYDQEERRGFFRRTLTSLAFTAGAILAVAIAVGMVVAVPALLGVLGLDAPRWRFLALLRWPILAAAVVLGLALLYRYGPSRDHAKWRWVTPGSLLATALWILGSIGFAVYVGRFGNMQKTYGSMAAVAILLLWFFLTAYVVILGAEVNGEMEHQTRRDSTTGPERPLGARGAYHADTVGPTPA